MTAKELREQRAALVVEIKRLADLTNAEKRDFTVEETEAWTKVNADYDAMSRQIEIAERAELVAGQQERRIDARAGRGDVNRDGPPAPADQVTEEDRGVALQAWFRSQLGEPLSERHVEACRKVRLNPTANELRANLLPTSEIRTVLDDMRTAHHTLRAERGRARMAERRALSAADQIAGGYTVPQGFVNALELNMVAFGGMLQVADILRTDSGNDLPWPTASDTGNTGEQLGESVSIGGSSVDPTFGQMVLHAYKFSSKPIMVPTELLEDSAFDMATIVGGMLGERLGRITNTRATTGTGAGTFKGVVTAATLGKTAASATAIVSDEILDLIHSVDPAYRTGAGFMLHDSILLALRKLKDGEGLYIWQSNIQQGSPDRLFGYPLTINQDMASAVTTTLKTLLFGQLNKYKIRQVRGVRFYRMVERYRDYDQDGFVAFLRQDGNLLDAGTAPVKYLQQA